jgi:carboxypeptidase C (cathepsin A)
VPNKPFDFTFLTVNAAGHMVPQVRPVRALAMISRFFNDKPF